MCAGRAMVSALRPIPGKNHPDAALQNGLPVRQSRILQPAEYPHPGSQPHFFCGLTDHGSSRKNLFELLGIAERENFWNSLPGTGQRCKTKAQLTVAYQQGTASFGKHGFHRGNGVHFKIRIANTGNQIIFFRTLLKGACTLPGGAQLRFPADKADFFVTLGGELPHACDDGPTGVCCDGIQRASGGCAIQKNDWNIRWQALGQIRIVFKAAGDDQGIYTRGTQRTDAGSLPYGILVGVGNNQAVSVIIQKFFNRTNQTGEKGIADVGYDKTNGNMCFPLKMPCGAIRHKAEIFNGSQHTLPGFRTHGACAIYYIGYGGDGYPCHGCNIEYGSSHSFISSCRLCLIFQRYQIHSEMSIHRYYKNSFLLCTLC